LETNLAPLFISTKQKLISSTQSLYFLKGRGSFPEKFFYWDSLTSPHFLSNLRFQNHPPFPFTPEILKPNFSFTGKIFGSSIGVPSSLPPLSWGSPPPLQLNFSP
jgi:hypothetical protein